MWRAPTTFHVRQLARSSAKRFRKKASEFIEGNLAFSTLYQRSNKPRDGLEHDEVLQGKK